MAYFPFYFELKGKKGIVIGGGKIALEKISRLSSFEADITVIAPDFLEEIKSLENEHIKLVYKSFEIADIKAAYYVIAATDDEAINEEICSYCRANSIPVNVVDDQEKCDFIFPSVVQRGPLVIGVSSSGASPQIAMNIRKQIEDIVPDNIEEILDFLAKLRPRIKQEVFDASKRHLVFKRIANACMNQNSVLTNEEVDSIISEALRNE